MKLKIRHSRAGENPARTNRPRSEQGHKLTRFAGIVQSSEFPPARKRRRFMLMDYSGIFGASLDNFSLFCLSQIALLRI